MKKTAIGCAPAKTPTSEATGKMEAMASRSGSKTPPPQDEDANGIDDPFLDELPLSEESNEQQLDDGPLSEIPIGLPLAPTDASSHLDESDLGPPATEDYSFDETDSSRTDDDESGPLRSFDLDDLDTPPGNEVDDPEDGPIESQLGTLEALDPLLRDGDRDDDPNTAIPFSISVDDNELSWSKERWGECPVRLAFSACKGLGLVGATLCVSGEVTSLIHSREVVPLESVAFDVSTKRVLFLDADASRLLLLTLTGRLYFLSRTSGQHAAPRPIAVPSNEIISSIWQLAPGVPTLLVRCESGRLFEWDDAGERLVACTRFAKEFRLRALSELGEPLVTLWQGRDQLQMRMGFGNETRIFALAQPLEQAIADSVPLLAGFVEHVLVGVRDHGLYLGGSDRPFTIVPGCRRMTSLAVGHLQQRPTAFVGLYSELEDRAEIALVDLPSRKANRVAELNVLSDGAGPDDDPPERARIDALLWDPMAGKLWAAGSFGLTCFAPSTTPDSI